MSLPLSDLYRTTSRQRLIDFFLEYDDDKPLTKAEIIEETGLARHSVFDHIHILEEMNIIRDVSGEGHSRYVPATESPEFRIVRGANLALLQTHERGQSSSDSTPDDEHEQGHE